jgi:hypothetical protein
MTKAAKLPPYAAIARLVDHTMNEDTIRDWREREERLGPIANRDHILNAAEEVQSWLDVLLMTPWSQAVMDRLEGRD